MVSYVFERELWEIVESFAVQILGNRIAQFSAKASKFRHFESSNEKNRC